MVQEIKLVHLRGEDFTSEEINYFHHNFKTRLFNCHEEHLDRLYQQFPRFRKNILLELNYNNKIENQVEPNKLGGFCIDLAHYQVAQDKNCCEVDYILKRLKNTPIQANHLNGYSIHSRTFHRDRHLVTNLKQFNYLMGLLYHTH